MPCGQIIFGPQNAAAPAGLKAYTYVAENRRWPRPKIQDTVLEPPMPGSQCWDPGAGTAKILEPRLLEPRFGEPGTNTDIGYAIWSCENHCFQITVKMLATC